MGKTYKITMSLVSAAICMLFSLVSCGDSIVTKCNQLDGTCWMACGKIAEQGDSLYNAKKGIIKFEDGQIYSGQTGRGMSYTCHETEGRIGNIGSFSLDGNGQLHVSVMSLHIPFKQIEPALYDSLSEIYIKKMIEDMKLPN